MVLTGAEAVVENGGIINRVYDNYKLPRLVHTRQLYAQRH